jgi:hypothetical protein
MPEGSQPDTGAAWTRASFLRAALGGGAVVAGGAALGAGRRDGAVSASAEPGRDAEVLNFFLTLEYVQQSFYEQAARSAGLPGPLLRYARTVGAQEAEHAAMLRKRLGRKARARPKSDAGDAVRSPEAFRSTAVDLEEAVVAAYVGQGANLSNANVVEATTLISVEARQAAWIRDLAKLPPAPRAADPARRPGAVLADLRRQGLLG